MEGVFLNQFRQRVSSECTGQSHFFPMAGLCTVSDITLTATHVCMLGVSGGLTATAVRRPGTVLHTVHLSDAI